MVIVNKHYFKQLCKQLNGIRYKNFCFLHKRNFNSKKCNLLKKLNFNVVKHKLLTEFWKKNYRIIIINLEKITYEIDDIIMELYDGKVPCWEMQKIIIDVFKNKNNHLAYLKSWLNIIQKNLINIKKCEKAIKFNSWRTISYHSYKFALIYDAILKNIVGQSVLDVGTATGILPIIIKKNFPYMKVAGGDICPLENTKLLSKNGNANVSFIYLNLLKNDILCGLKSAVSCEFFEV